MKEKIGLPRVHRNFISENHLKNPFLPNWFLLIFLFPSHSRRAFFFSLACTLFWKEDRRLKDHQDISPFKENQLFWSIKHVHKTMWITSFYLRKKSARVHECSDITSNRNIEKKVINLWIKHNNCIFLRFMS